jgi:hypothetical protein
MINLFRKIRRQLSHDNKPVKYFRYAIGEIVLVMVGILLALQVNNWNESRKEHILEKKIYSDLYKSLQTDSIQLIRIIDLLNSSILAQETLIKTSYAEIVQENNIKELLIEIHKGVFSFFPKYGVYNLITNNGNLNLLRSESIKSNLVELYDYEYNRYENIDKIMESRFEFDFTNIISGKMEYLWNGNKEIISDLSISKFKNHFEELLEVVRTMYEITNASKDTLLNIQEQVNNLLLLIKLEVKS